MERSAFDILIEQCQVLAVKLETTKSLIAEHRYLHNSIIPVLQKKQDCIRRAMAQWLHHRLKGKGLTVRHERMMRRLICSIAMRLAISGDQTMRALHDAHSAISLAEIELAEVSEAQAYLKAAMGEAFGRDQVFETLDDVLHAKFEFIRKEAEARSKNSAARRAKKTKGSASQQAANDVEGALLDCLPVLNDEDSQRLYQAAKIGRVSLLPNGSCFIVKTNVSTPQASTRCPRANTFNAPTQSAFSA